LQRGAGVPRGLEPNGPASFASDDRRRVSVATAESDVADRSESTKRCDISAPLIELPMSVGAKTLIIEAAQQRGLFRAEINDALHGSAPRSPRNSPIKVALVLGRRSRRLFPRRRGRLP
jgi:hypothetical protein